MVTRVCAISGESPVTMTWRQGAATPQPFAPVVGDRDVHGCHTGDIDHDDFRAVGANSPKELLRQLAGALRVDHADDGKNQEPLANLQHGSGEFTDASCCWRITRSRSCTKPTATVFAMRFAAGS